MTGIFGYLKAPPTTYVLHYQNGRLRREGAGLAFLYFRPSATIVTVPLSSTVVPFVFNETTADFQAVTIQGQLTYRITDPKRISGLLDFSNRYNGGYVSDDPDKLPERLVEVLQLLARETLQHRDLRQALGSSDAIQREVLEGARSAQAITLLGIEIISVSILSVKPTPEISRALEAEAREALQRESDEAIYARRNAAVAQERTIKESELNTEIAVQEKQRQMREAKVQADIAVEQQRTALIERRVANERQDADSKAYALRAQLDPIRDVDWRTLMALSTGGTDPKLMVALAFRELAQNAGKIGELNVTPDLLKSLITANAPTK